MDDPMPSEKKSQERALEACLASARMCKLSGMQEEAERLYKGALQQAEAVAGANSPLVGLVLLDFIEFYDLFERYHEGQLLWPRLRNVLASLATDE